MPRPRIPPLTVFGRSVLLIASEILANIVCWIAAGLLFGIREDTRDILSLALLAWTLGLRHGLDADHISAIDNATRGLISIGQLPVTCGLYFSLGHSTIVIIVNIAIAISTDVYERIGGIGEVGGIVGAAVSGSFLFIIGVANSIILWKIVRERRSRQRRNASFRNHPGQPSTTPGEEQGESDVDSRSFMMRIIGPVTSFVDKPWKMYPVGVLFGFGFDTASSIALLAISAIAKKDSNGRQRIRHGDIIILPLLFTAGMTFVDSVDSVLMLYSYAGAPEKGRGFAIFERGIKLGEGSLLDAESSSKPSSEDIHSFVGTSQIHSRPSEVDGAEGEGEGDRAMSNPDIHMQPQASRHQEEDGAVLSDTQKAARDRDHQIRQNTMSGLSIILTLISIMVAFSISLITIMALVGENCKPCREAAEAEDGGGLAGKWWRGWARANDQSGVIGAAIVGCFLVVVVGYYGVEWAKKRMSERREPLL